MGKHITVALALVSAREHSDLQLVVQQVYEIFHVRGLARTSHGDVAHRYDGYVVALAFEHSDVKHPVAYSHTDAVQPAQRHKPLIYFYEISFCSHFFCLLSNVQYVWHACLQSLSVVEIAHHAERLIHVAQRQT